METLIFFTAVLWILAFIGVVTVGFWILEVALLRQKPEQQIEYNSEDVHARILTIDNQEVVQESVNTLKQHIRDIHVVAEEEIEVEGAEVHVVPEDFECDAVRKGRAIEWAARNLETEKEFVLYVDEDSKLKEFSGLPDSDIVQFRELPQRTGSLLSFLADIFRMGIRWEQLAFPRLRIPLFAWGGGLAVRKGIEEDVTWERKTVVEDTVFTWLAALENASYTVIDTYIENQSPPTSKALLKQRRRWAGGNQRQLKNLPQPYRVISRLRNYSWALTPLTAFLLPLVLFLNPVKVVGQQFLEGIGMGMATVIPAWYVLGVMYYPENKFRKLVFTPLSPVAAVLHGLGGLWGLIDPPETFQVTPKTSRDKVQSYRGRGILSQILYRISGYVKNLQDRLKSLKQRIKTALEAVD